MTCGDEIDKGCKRQVYIKVMTEKSAGQIVENRLIDGVIRFQQSDRPETSDHTTTDHDTYGRSHYVFEWHYRNEGDENFLRPIKHVICN